MKSPIFEGFMSDRQSNTCADICINLYPEHVHGEKGPVIGLLVGLPGRSLETTVGNGPIRAGHVGADGLLYVLSGNAFYSLDTAYNATHIGDINTSSGPATIIDNPTQVSIFDGKNGWVATKGTTGLTLTIPNPDTDIQHPVIALYQDGFGIVNDAGSNQIYQSNYNDLSVFASLIGTGGSTANNAFVQSDADPVVSVAEIKREAWIFKKKCVEVWVNQGTAGFAFGQLQGVLIPTGCEAPYSVARLGDSLVWLSSSDQGDSVIVESTGYQSKPISTYFIASVIKSLTSRSDAFAYSHQWNEHEFYVITFPTDGYTFAYDRMTSKWHQRCYFSNGLLLRDRANCHMNFNGKSLLGDYQNGKIYSLSDTVFTDAGDIRKWVRRWKALSGDAPRKETTFDFLQVLMETGIDVPVDLNPQLTLRWSDDGGQTWIGSVMIPCGKIGETSWRAVQNRLGSTTLRSGLDRVWEISGTDPIPIKINGAEWEGGQE